MCQRYVLPPQFSAEREFLPAVAWWKFTQRFNVAAGEYVPAIRMHDGQSEGVMLRWGLIPSWFEGDPGGPLRANVPCEGIESSTAHRAAWLGSQRCILPVAGFYSWQLTREKYRQPYFVRLADRSVFGIAGIWDRWVSEDDDVIESCSIVSVPANELMLDVGLPDPRMPAILRRKDYSHWLTGSPAQARSALQPYNPHWMQAHRVSPRINARNVDDPGLIRIAS